MARRVFKPSAMVEHFESLSDPRDTRNRKHLLVDVIVISICGVLIGCDGPTSIARWALIRRDWLAQFLQLPNGIPSRDCIRRVLSALQPAAFQKCFAAWIASRVARDETNVLRLIAIDGKTSRRSHDRAAGLGPLHLVSAWATEEGIALGQVATDEKSNEITAIPALLDQIDVRDALVTIDAMGCQKEIAAKIVAQGGDFALAVKDNQPKLSAAIRQFFAQHLEDNLSDLEYRHHETRDEEHGRIDERAYYLAKVPQDFSVRKQWPHVKAIGYAVRLCEHADGRQSHDVRYYILSRYVSGRRFAEAVRGHWGIENSLHWVLDMNFREDESRTRHRVFADNLSWLRRFAITLLKHHPKKESLRGKMQIASWSDAFLAEVLVGQRT